MVDGGPIERVRGGLPEWLRGNVDTRCIGSDGRRIALVDGHGDVWSSADDLESWEQIASGLQGVTAVAVA